MFNRIRLLPASGFIMSRKSLLVTGSFIISNPLQWEIKESSSNLVKSGFLPCGFGHGLLSLERSVVFGLLPNLAGLILKLSFIKIYFKRRRAMMIELKEREENLTQTTDTQAMVSSPSPLSVMVFSIREKCSIHSDLLEEIHFSLNLRRILLFLSVRDSKWWSCQWPEGTFSAW